MMSFQCTGESNPGARERFAYRIILRMRVLFLETFYGGSHKTFADQFAETSRNEIHLVTLPARFWKWRQAGSAMRLSQIIPPKADTHFDVVLVGGMLDLAHLKVLRPDLPPILLYLHENQFAYPLSPGEKIDFRYGLVDVMNILASGKAAFNSSYNRNSLIMECRNLFRRLPDAIPRDIPAKLEEKSTVLYPGIAPTTCTQDRTTRHPERKIPLVIWNHRHEHDKNPEAAFDALIRLSRRSVPFELAILGENFSDEPEAFNRARQHLRKHIVFDGYPERIRYNEWLDKGSVVISTARQENFGLSVIEAAAAGCWPLVPRRLAYPEVMPEWVSGACFWDDEPSLDVKLEMILRLSGTERRKLTAPLSSWLKTYEWTVRAPLIDDVLEGLA
jgi:glycosyltransferase involved in cell wall biosynthesis